MKPQDNSVRVGIIVGDFHKSVAEVMLQSAKETVADEGGQIEHILFISGSYEAPIAVKRMMDDPQIDLIVLLGYIEKGETLHGEVMGYVVHKSIIDLELRYGKPVGFGVIGPGATIEQAKIRQVDYAKAAVKAAFRLFRTLQDYDSHPQ